MARSIRAILKAMGLMPQSESVRAREQLPNWVKQEKIEKAVAKREMRAAKRRALEK